MPETTYLFSVMSTDGGAEGRKSPNFPKQSIEEFPKKCFGNFLEMFRVKLLKDSLNKKNNLIIVCRQFPYESLEDILK